MKNYSQYIKKDNKRIEKWLTDTEVKRLLDEDSVKRLEEGDIMFPDEESVSVDNVSHKCVSTFFNNDMEDNIIIKADCELIIKRARKAGKSNQEIEKQLEEYLREEGKSIDEIAEIIQEYLY